MHDKNTFAASSSTACDAASAFRISLSAPKAPVCAPTAAASAAAAA